MFIFKSSASLPKTKLTVPDSQQFIGLVSAPDGYGLIVVDSQLITVKDIAAVDTSIASVFCGLRDYVTANIRSGFSYESFVARAAELGASAELKDSADTQPST